MVKVPIKPSNRPNYTEIFLILASGEFTTQEILKQSSHTTSTNNISQFLNAIDKEGLLIINKKFKHKKFKYTLNHEGCFKLLLSKLDSIYKTKMIDLKDQSGNIQKIHFQASSVWNFYELDKIIYDFFKRTLNLYLAKIHKDPIPSSHRSISNDNISSISDYFTKEKVTFSTLIDYYIYSIQSNSEAFLRDTRPETKVAIDNFTKWCKFYANQVMFHGILIKFE